MILEKVISFADLEYMSYPQFQILYSHNEMKKDYEIVMNAYENEKMERKKWL